MPLTSKGNKIMSAMKKQYGSKKVSLSFMPQLTRVQSLALKVPGRPGKTTGRVNTRGRNDRDPVCEV